MKETRGTKAPKARKDQLIVKEVRDEVLVYDLKNYKAHCLNDTAARVWKNCDGRRSVSDIAKVLEKDLNSPVNDQVVWLALNQLDKFSLLTNSPAQPKGSPQISRRALIRTGVTAAVLLPVIFTISAPTALAAGTPVTSVICQGRHDTDPGSCGGGPCTDVAGTFCKPNGNSCQCKP